MRYVVTVLPGAGVSDPQGEAILDAARSLGFDEVRDIRAGRSFVVEVRGENPDRVRALADALLANPVTETFSVREDA